MNVLWDVPLAQRPNFLITRLRSLIMLAIMGTFVLGSTLLAGLGVTSGGVSPALRVLGIIGSLALNLILYLVAFRVLTRKNLKWGDVLAGAIFSAVLLAALQELGHYYVTHPNAGAQALARTCPPVLW